VTNALKWLKKNFMVLLMWVSAIIFILPFYIAFVTSFKTPLESAKSLLSLPTVFHFENYAQALKMSSFFVSLKNSLIFTICSVVLIIVSASMAAYVIARNMKRKRFYAFLEKFFLAAIPVAFEIIMIPVYQLFYQMNLINTLPGAIIAKVGMSIPFALFMFIGFIKTIPVELEEAAYIDGAGKHRTFWTIVFPLLKPAVASLAAAQILWTWNDFSVSLILLQKDSVKTIPLQQFVFFGQYTSNFNLGFAAAIVSMIPIYIFFAAAQKYIVAGMTTGAVKG